MLSRAMHIDKRDRKVPLNERLAMSENGHKWLVRNVPDQRYL